MNRIYVGNLAYETRVDELRNAFAEFFEVTSVTIVADRRTGRSRGFGFVELAAAAPEVIAVMHGELLHGRRLNVSLARDTRLVDDSNSGPAIAGDVAEASVSDAAEKGPAAVDRKLR